MSVLLQQPKSFNPNAILKSEDKKLTIPKFPQNHTKKINNDEEKDTKIAENTIEPIKQLIKLEEKPINNIIINDEKIISFFETHCIDPSKFILSSIDNYLTSLNNIKPLSTDISKTDLIKFQNEYNMFVNTKKSISNNLRDTAKQIDNMNLENFDTFLSNKFGISREIFPCTICNLNSYRSKKALATHQRKCKKDYNDDNDNDNEDYE